MRRLKRTERQRDKGMYNAPKGITVCSKKKQDWKGWHRSNVRSRIHEGKDKGKCVVDKR